MNTLIIGRGLDGNLVRMKPETISEESIYLLKELIKNDLKANANVWQYERRKELYKLAYEFELNDFVNEQKIINND